MSSKICTGTNYAIIYNDHVNSDMNETSYTVAVIVSRSWRNCKIRDQNVVGWQVTIWKLDDYVQSIQLIDR